MKNKTINKNELDKSNVYINIKKYCELRNTSRWTVDLQIQNKQFSHTIVNIKGMRKTRFVVVKKGSIFIDKNDNIIIIKE